MSFSGGGRKYGFQTPIKYNEDIIVTKNNKSLLNSNIQYQSTNNNENRNKNIERPFSQKSKSIENRDLKKNYLNNKSYNDFNNNNKNKKIRINFKPIEENEFDDLNNSKKIDIVKNNSNQKIKKNESIINNKRKNNKVNHYKSRSLKDIENPISLKNYPKNISDKENNNYTITDNQKITKIRSTKCASVYQNNKYINNNNHKYSIKPKKPFINISFINLHTNDNKPLILEPKKYKGPIDLCCILISKSLNSLIEKVSDLLKRYKIANIFINQYILRCTKNGLSFDFEFMSLNDNLTNNNNNVSNNYYLNVLNLKTNAEIKLDKTINLYYYTIVCKAKNDKKNDKNLIKTISRLISSKFGNLKNKK